MLRGGHTCCLSIKSRAGMFAGHCRPDTKSHVEHHKSPFKALAGLALCPLCASAGFTAEEHHWRRRNRPRPLGRHGCLEQGLFGRIATVAPPYRQHHLGAASAAQDRLGQEGRYYPQQRAHYSAQLRPKQHARRRYRQLYAAAIPLPSAERAPDQRQELSDGSALRAPQRLRNPGGRGRADDGRQGQRGVQ